jgi:hypothetical protein
MGHVRRWDRVRSVTTPEVHTAPERRQGHREEACRPDDDQRQKHQFRATSGGAPV